AEQVLALLGVARVQAGERDAYPEFAGTGLGQRKLADLRLARRGALPLVIRRAHHAAPSSVIAGAARLIRRKASSRDSGWRGFPKRSCRGADSRRVNAGCCRG